MQNVNLYKVAAIPDGKPMPGQLHLAIGSTSVAMQLRKFRFSVSLRQLPCPLFAAPSFVVAIQFRSIGTNCFCSPQTTHGMHVFIYTTTRIAKSVEPSLDCQRDATHLSGLCTSGVYTRPSESGSNGRRVLKVMSPGDVWRAHTFRRKISELEYALPVIP